jgi:aromatic-L-amino-acid decarboxylase
MFVPVDCSILFVKEPEVLKRAFSLNPEYLKTTIDGEVINYHDYGLQLGRRFRSLKLWFVIKYFGAEGMRDIIKWNIETAQIFKHFVEDDKDFELMAPVPFSTICFRYKPVGYKGDVDELNSRLMDEINKNGKIFISHTKLNDRFVMRLVVSGVRTEERTVREAWKLIKEVSKTITSVPV